MISDLQIKEEYAKRFPILEETARKLTENLKEILKGIERIDSITSRAKDPDRYFAKSTKKIIPTDRQNTKIPNTQFKIRLVHGLM